MNFSDLETVRTHWKLTEDAMATLLGLDGAASYTGLNGKDIPGTVSTHVNTLKMVRNINRGVFNNYLTKTIK